MKMWLKWGLAFTVITLVCFMISINAHGSVNIVFGLPFGVGALIVLLISYYFGFVNPLGCDLTSTFDLQNCTAYIFTSFGVAILFWFIVGVIIGLVISFVKGK